jgi:hypothetical protein
MRQEHDNDDLVSKRLHAAHQQHVPQDLRRLHHHDFVSVHGALALYGRLQVVLGDHCLCNIRHRVPHKLHFRIDVALHAAALLVSVVQRDWCVPIEQHVVLCQLPRGNGRLHNLWCQQQLQVVLQHWRLPAQRRNVLPNVPRRNC